MLKSERESLIRFLIIYLGSTFILFAIASWGFYTVGKQHLLDKQRQRLDYISEKLAGDIRRLHQSDAAVLYYPTFKNGDSAIYDLDKRYIFGSFSHPRSLREIQNDTASLSVVRRIEPYYLGTAYLAVTAPVDNAPIEKLRRDIIVFMIVSGVFFGVLGYFLGKLFIKPMRDAMEKLGRFIQDTTHELNTPISTIVTNIELMESLHKCPEAALELKRIDIAAKTLHRIYDDLSYLNLNHQYHRKVEEIDMSALLKERLTYFSVMTEAKQLKVHTNIDQNVTKHIDRNDAIRLVDNLLSNAIKYNKPHGFLRVTLTSDLLSIEDGGEGIPPEALRYIKQRFVRANKAEGGFGIGLHIVDSVAKHYNFKLEIDSTPNVGTKVRIRW